jgi:hypothetical protein
MSIITFAKVFRPWHKIAASCAVPDCDDFVEEGSNSSWCESCLSNPAAVLERLGIDTQESVSDHDAGQTGRVEYSPIG